MKTKLLFLLSFICSISFAQYTVNTSSPLQYEKFEIEIDLSHNHFSVSDRALIDSKNPYDKNDIVLEVTFTDPNGNTIQSNGFLYENFDIHTSPQVDGENCGSPPKNPNKIFPYIPKQFLAAPSTGQEFSWKARFSPQIPGTWSYSINYHFPSSPSIFVGSGSFTCVASSNKGFISVQNNVFQFSDNSGFIPIGMNLPTWPNSTCEYQGSNFYDVMFDRLNENGANFCRIFIDHEFALNLYGVRNTFDRDVVFNNNGLYDRAYYDQFRQMGSFQLDKIIEKAEEKGIHIQLCLNYRTLRLDQWGTNAFNTNSSHGIQSQRGNCVTIEDVWGRADAIAVQKNLMRYIVDRWSYSTSLFSIDMVNEADLLVQRFADDNLGGMTRFDAFDRVGQKMVNWNNELVSTIRTHDHYGHPITTSFGQYQIKPVAPPTIYYNNNVNGFKNLLFEPSNPNAIDYYEFHYYPKPQGQSIYRDSIWPMIDEKEEMIDRLNSIRLELADIPVMIGEHGINYMAELPESLKGSNFYPIFDPGALSHHSSLWSSLLSGFMGPVSVWDRNHFIEARDSSQTNPASVFMEQFKPVSEFAQQIGKFDYSVQKNYHDKNDYLSNYYLADQKRNKVYGWAQNNQFSFHELIGPYDHGPKDAKTGAFNNAHDYITSGLVDDKPIWDTDLAHRTINITVPKTGSYSVMWYDAETGLQTIEETYESCSDQLTIVIPTSEMGSKFGDVAYIASHNGHGESIANGSNIVSPEVVSTVNFQGNSSNGVFYIDQETESFAKSTKVLDNWMQEFVGISVPPIYSNTDFYIDDNTSQSIVYCGVENNIINFYEIYKLPGTSDWQLKKLTNQSNLSINPNSNIEKIGTTFFYTRNDDKIGAMYPCGQQYNCAGKLSSNSPEIVEFPAIDVTTSWPSTVYYLGRNTSGVKNIYKSYYSGGWQLAQLTMSNNPSANLNIRPSSKVKFKDQTIGFVIRHDGLISAIYDCGQQYMCNTTTNSSAVTVKQGTDLTVPKTGQTSVYYIGEDGNIYKQYWNGGQWQSELMSTDACFNGVKDNTSLLYFDNQIFFIDKIDGKIHVLDKTDPNVILRRKSPQYFNDYLGSDKQDLKEIDFYPNPTNGLIRLSETVQEVRIFSLVGQLLEIEENTNNLNLSSFKKGTYILKFRQGNHIQVEKVVLQ